jgi:hypothetical protein
MELYPATSKALDDQLQVWGLVNWVMGFLTDGPDPVANGVGEAVTGSNDALAESCGGGWIRLVRLSIKLGVTDLNMGLRFACLNGRTDCARLMVDLGATDLNGGGLGIACGFGHTECARLMVNSGATELEWGLIYACQSGHLDCLRLMLNSGAKTLGVSLWSYRMRSAHGGPRRDKL